MDSNFGIYESDFYINEDDFYIDFDDTILFTSDLLFEEYRKLKKVGEEVDKIKYIQNFDWVDLLNRCEIINNSIEILKGMRNAKILTKVHSMDNEAVAKIKYLRSKGVENDIILSPYLVKKSEVVNPCGKVLVDDTIHNLDDWDEKGGISVFFNKDGHDIDSWNQVNKKYVKIRSLDELKHIKL